MKLSAWYFFLFCITLFFSCSSSTDKRKIDVSKVEINNITIGRYDQALFKIDKSKLKLELQRIQPQFPMFLDGDLNDTLNLKRMADYLNDTLLISVYNDCQVRLPDLAATEEQLTRAFRHFKYYFPRMTVPDVYCYISGFDYEYPVQYFEDHLLIAIDLYMGADYYRYRKLGLANYIIRRFSKEYIVRDCLFAMAQAQIDRNHAGSALLDQMISQGKLLWFADAMLPDLPETILLDYTPTQWEWAVKGEAIVWAFLIENEMLYSTEMQPIQKFIADGPFTSYFGADSPPRLGAFIGWRIVTSYMNRHTDITPDKLMKNYNSQEILNQSGYKPKN